MSSTDSQKEAVFEKVRRKLDQFDDDDLIKMWKAFKKTEINNSPSIIPGVSRRELMAFIRKELDRRGAT